MPLPPPALWREGGAGPDLLERPGGGGGGELWGLREVEGQKERACRG